MNSFDILSPQTVVQPRLFLQASAGTGKTFTLEHLVARLLLETELQFEQIVIVTFTRAATRELKERIRENLLSIVHKKGSHAYLEGITPSQNFKIEEALRGFERAHIFTIHGFCSHLLKQFAIEAGLSLHFSEWTREEESWEFKEYLRQQTVISPGQIHLLLSLFRYDLEELEKAVLSQTDHTDNFNSYDILFKKTRQRVNDIEPFDLTSEFEEVRSSYKGMSDSSYSLQAQELEQAIKEKRLSFDVWDKWIKNSPFFLKNITPHNLKIRAKKSASAKLHSLREYLLPLLEEAQDTSRIFSLFCKGWQLHKEKAAFKKDKISMDDLIKHVHSKLQEDTFVQTVRNKYHCLIVDEFQDTDPLQWDIFRTLFMNDKGKRAYLVGDPKQSIYAFRKADLYTFLKAASEFEAGQQASLVCNYRSSSALLSELNRLLCQGEWLDLPKQGGFLRIEPAISAHEGEGFICFMIAEGEKGKSVLWPTVEIEENQLFPFIAHEIESRRLDCESCAVLVKDRYQAARLKSFLDRWNIPSHMTRVSSLSQSHVLEYIEEVIEACLDPHQTCRIKKVLLGPFMSILPAEMSDEMVFEVKKYFIDLRERWEKEGFASFFACFLNKPIQDKIPILNFYLVQDEKSYNDLMELVQQLLPFSHPYQIREALKEIVLKRQEERVSIQTDGVQIMTVHASKGLEFKTVFALALASRSSSKSSQQKVPEDVLKEQDAEKMRQLYVALTRAAKQLYIPIVKELPEASYEIGQGSAMEIFLSRVKPDLSSFRHVFLSEQKVFFKPRPNPTIALFEPCVIPRPKISHLYLKSFSGLAQGESLKVIQTDPNGIEAGTKTGVIIHKILERYFNQEGELSHLISEEIRLTPLRHQKEQIEKMIQNVFELSLDSFSLNEIALERVMTEMEFVYKTNQGWMKGYIDLCFEHNGMLYVVDWKTNLLYGKEEKDLKQLMEANDYFLQGKIYQEAVKKHLQTFYHVSAKPLLPFGGIYFIFMRGPCFYKIDPQEML